MGEMRTKFWLEKLNGRDNLEELGIDGKIKLNRVGRCGLNVCGSG
jgi:hypothetical protein